MEHSKSLKSCERDTKYSRFHDAASWGGGFQIECVTRMIPYVLD